MKIFIISHKRSHAVPFIQEQFGTDVTWVVGENESQAYRDNGATNVIEGGGLMASRNIALNIAFAENRVCVQISDDFKKAKSAITGKLHTGREAAEILVRELNDSPFKFAGFGPTDNAFYFNPKSPIKIRNFIVGDFIAVKPCDLRFDTHMRLKEDYDYTAQHIAMYGGTLRVDYVLASFVHRTNKGGACDYRTSQLEQESISYLQNKWPGWFRLNPKRENEVLFSPPAVLKPRKVFS